MKENILANKLESDKIIPVLLPGDLIQWNDMSIGIVLEVEYMTRNSPKYIDFLAEECYEPQWLYTILWQGTNEAIKLPEQTINPARFASAIREPIRRWKFLAKGKVFDKRTKA